MDIRQSIPWGDFLTKIGWQTQPLDSGQIFIRKIPLSPFSLIKLQRMDNPLPFEKIDQIAKQHHALCTIIEPSDTNFQEAVFKQSGFFQALSMALLPTSTSTINLNQSEKTLWSSFSENARRNIKKAQKNNLETRIVFLNEPGSEKFFNQFFVLLSNLKKMKGFYLPGYDEFYKKMQAFKNNSVFLFAYSPKNTQPIAGVWLGFFDTTAVYMHAGNTEEGYKLLANYLLVWEALKLAQKLKLKVFDFEGLYDLRFPRLRRSWMHFSEFKHRFHGQIIEYPQPYIKCYNIVFKLFFLCGQVIMKS